MRNNNMLKMPTLNTVKYGKNSFKYTGCHLWNMLPN